MKYQLKQSLIVYISLIIENMKMSLEFRSVILRKTFTGQLKSNPALIRYYIYSKNDTIIDSPIYLSYSFSITL